MNAPVGAIDADAQAEIETRSIRAWPTTNPGPAALPILVGRINAQKGGFRGISEQSLELEIATLEPNGAVAEDRSESEGEDEEEKPKREQLRLAKEELMKFAA